MKRAVLKMLFFYKQFYALCYQCQEKHINTELYTLFYKNVYKNIQAQIPSFFKNTSYSKKILSLTILYTLFLNLFLANKCHKFLQF